MSKSSEHSDDMAEARRLIDAACDGRLTAPQATRLEKLARARHEVLILYIEMMHLTAWLHQHAAAMGADPAQQPVQDLNESMILPAIRPEDIEDALDQPEPAPSWELPRRHSSRRRLWATAASVLIAAIVLSFVLRSVLRTSAGLHATQVASVVRSIQAGWEGQSPGQVLTAGREYALKTGLVELNLSETRVVVQGPARFTMLDSRMIELKNGMLTALCAKGGLSVKTPNAAVLDLGTEFGVRVDDAGTDVEVFQGRVSLTPAIAGTQKDGNLQSGTILEVGVAKRVNPTGTVLDAAPDEGRFVRAGGMDQWASAAAQAAETRWRTSRDRVRNDPELALYYTCDELSKPSSLSNRATDTAGTGDIPFVADAPSWSPGRWLDKGALSFHPSQKTRLLLTDFPFSKTGQLSVFAWVFAEDRTFWASIVKCRGGKLDGQFSLGLVAREGDLIARVTQANGTEVSVREGASSPLPTGRWIQVGFVADGRQLRLYRDGRMVASASCLPVTDKPTPDSLAIGFRTGDDGRTPLATQAEFWSGMIDEIAIFHRSLSDQEIRDSYESGNPN